MSKKITYTFKKGVTLTETPETLAKVAAGFGETFTLDGYYASESRGFIKFKDMHDAHLQNAVIKEIRENLDKLSLEVREGISCSKFLILFKDKVNMTGNMNQFNAELKNRARTEYSIPKTTS